MRLARFGEFEQTGRAARFGARYRAGSDEVAGARAGAVDGKMRKELRRVPIHMREVAFCYPDRSDAAPPHLGRSEEHTSELQSLMRISSDVFCLKKKNDTNPRIHCHYRGRDRIGCIYRHKIGSHTS